MEATKTNPAALDAFETAKSDEPIWTVQGGDPLGAPLLRIWAVFARIRAGIIPDQGTEIVYAELLKAAQNNRPEHQNEIDGLLIRATETEQVSWSMDNYIKGLTAEEVEELKQAIEFNRLDLYDLRRKCASFISAFFSEFNDYRLELIKREYLAEGDFIDHQMQRAIADLRYILSTIEIRRGN